MPRASPSGAPVPLRWQKSPDGRSLGTITQYIRDFMERNPRGHTRGELKMLVRRRFKDRFPANPQAFTALVSRMIRRGDIVEVDGRLFARRRRDLVGSPNEQRT